MKLVECVPNISEGRNPESISRIADSASAVTGMAILDVDSNADANRSVITLAGSPEADAPR
ncbi:hypothetical protein JW948_11960 [bacterium]|nr:hypothetical protein [bacterium]